MSSLISQALVGELRFGAEHVRIVLGEAAHAHQVGERARGLIAVHHAEFGETAAGGRDSSSGRA